MHPLRREAAERAIKGLGAFQICIGLAALTVSRPVATVVGLRSSRLTGEAIFGWRLFALRQLLMGAGVWADVQPIRRANWVLQPADLLLFLDAFGRGYVPRRASAVSAGFAAAAIAALASERHARATDPPRGGESA